MGIPGGLADALSAVTVVVGHYGAGKTNFSVNLAIDLASSGADVALVDLDIVNPYFRASEQRRLLEEHGVRLIAPVFAEAGTSLDVPSLTGQIAPAIQGAWADGNTSRYVIVDAGGDDVGATALGRFSRFVKEGDYAMLYVANRYRNLVQDPVDALENMHEIEAACHLEISAIVGNAHLKDETSAEVVRLGKDYATELSELSHKPLVATCAHHELTGLSDDEDVYRINIYVRSPWE